MLDLSCDCAWYHALVGYAPGFVIGLLIWLIARRNAAMPFFPADVYSFVLPIVVWFVMNKYHWTLAQNAHSHWQELMVLGWVWSFWFCLRLLIPRFTHKLRFRLAAIHTGTLSVIAAILLGLFFPGF